MNEGRRGACSFIFLEPGRRNILRAWKTGSTHSTVDARAPALKQPTPLPNQVAQDCHAGQMPCEPSKVALLPIRRSRQACHTVTSRSSERLPDANPSVALQTPVGTRGKLRSDSGPTAHPDCLHFRLSGLRGWQHTWRVLSDDGRSAWNAFSNSSHVPRLW